MQSRQFTSPIFMTIPNVPTPKCLLPFSCSSLSIESDTAPETSASNKTRSRTPVLSIDPPKVPTPSSLRHVRIKGDGRCLFRAIARNLARFDNRPLPEHMERADADYLRQLAWTSICKKRRQEFVRRHIVEGSIQSYCSVSNQPTFYAGEPELLALSDELQVPIAVYLRTGSGGGGGMTNIATYGEQYSKLQKNKKSNKTIRLLYVNGNHYDALL